MARTFVKPVPLPTIPQRPQFDGMAMGRELSDIIRRNRTMSAVNKALEQHGTLSSPEAIETVRKGMGTWFSDPDTVIRLQSELAEREKGFRDEKRENLKGAQEALKIEQANKRLVHDEARIKIEESQQAANEDAENRRINIAEAAQTSLDDHRDATNTRLNAALEVTQRKQKIGALEAIRTDISEEKTNLYELFKERMIGGPFYEAHIAKLKVAGDELEEQIRQVVDLPQEPSDVTPDAAPETAVPSFGELEVQVEDLSYAQIEQLLDANKTTNSAWGRGDVHGDFLNLQDKLRIAQRALDDYYSKPEQNREKIKTKEKEIERLKGRLNGIIEANKEIITQQHQLENPQMRGGGGGDDVNWADAAGMAPYGGGSDPYEEALKRILSDPRGREMIQEVLKNLGQTSDPISASNPMQQ
jgi:hypothetical protein